MKPLTTIGRLFYGIGIASLGIHQFIIRDFRPDILPPFPAWAHAYMLFPILAGLVLIIVGSIISGLMPIKIVSQRSLCLYLGFCFVTLILVCHLPYILFISSNKPTRLDVWFGVGETLAYAGGAFVMAGSFSNEGDNNRLISLLEKLIPLGQVFYAALIILFGFSHFVFTDFVSKMVPAWIGSQLFWTYFAGGALIGSGVAITIRIWVKTVSLLLALMLFLFFLLFHIPDAIANPTVGGGNEIFRAMVALLFCGIALVTAANVDASGSKE